MMFSITHIYKKNYQTSSATLSSLVLYNVLVQLLNVVHSECVCSHPGCRRIAAYLSVGV